MEDSRSGGRHAVLAAGQITRHIQEARGFVGPFEVPAEVHEFPCLIAGNGGRRDAEECFRRTPDVFIIARRVVFYQAGGLLGAREQIERIERFP